MQCFVRDWIEECVGGVCVCEARQCVLPHSKPSPNLCELPALSKRCSELLLVSIGLLELTHLAPGQ